MNEIKDLDGFIKNMRENKNEAELVKDDWTVKLLDFTIKVAEHYKNGVN